MLLLKAPAREWTAEEVAQSLRTSTELAGSVLGELNRLGLIEKSATPQPHFRYAPAQKELDNLSQELARLYPIYRVRVIEFLYHEKKDPLLVFKDAFRLRKESDDS